MSTAKRTAVLGSTPGATTHAVRALATVAVQRRDDLEPGDALYRAVRAAAVLQGQTFACFCRNQQVEPNWARQALTGERDGSKARALRSQLVQAAGLPAPGA